MIRDLFTGNIFPETVFSIQFDKAIVFEFDVVFRDVFAQKLSEFCESNRIDIIKIESLDQQYLFNKEINCSIIEIDYVELLRNTYIKEELPQELTYYVLLSNFIIYSNSSQFGFYANRDFDIGILTYNDNSVNVTMFKDLIWGVSINTIFKTRNYNEGKSKRVISQFQGKEFFFDSE